MRSPYTSSLITLLLLLSSCGRPAAPAVVPSTGTTTDAHPNDATDTPPTDSHSTDLGGSNHQRPGDTGAADIPVPDSYVPDVPAPDSYVPDAPWPDTHPPDTHKADSESDTDSADTPITDAQESDAQEPDTPATDTHTPAPDTNHVDAAAADSAATDAISAATDTTNAATDTSDPAFCPFGKSLKDLGCGFQGVCAGKVKITCYGDTATCDYSDALDWQPVETACDGKDNDCDGYTDNNMPKPLAKTWPNKGVCSKALQVCSGVGGWVEPVAWQVPNYEVAELSCDGKDNDCDGITDSDIQAKPPLTSGQGVCGGLSMQCVAGIWTAPKPATAPDWEPIEVSCDGLDNDCDGKTDEGLIAPATLPGGVAVLSEGVCAGAKPMCVGGAWKAPDYHAFVAGLPALVTQTYEATETSCDGLDNDCDGLTDEGLVGPLAKQQLGVCKGALQVCNGSWSEPNYPMIPGYQSGPEVGCDRLDNDCDGLTDEGNACPIWQVGGVNAGGMLAHGQRVAWAAGSGVVVHHATTGARLATHLEHEQPVLAMSLSPDGKSLATVGANQVLRIRPLLGGSASNVTIDAPNKTWTAVAFAPTGKQIATADSVGWVRLLSLPGGQTALAKKVHSGPVRRLLWLQSGPFAGARLFSGDDAGKLVVWQPNTLVTQVWTPSFVPVTSGPVRSIAADAKGTLVAVAWSKAGVAVLRPEKGVVQGGPLLANKGASALAFDAAGRLWIGNDDGELRRYHAVKTGSPSWTLGWVLPAAKVLPAPGGVVAVRVRADGSLLVAGTFATGRRSLQGQWETLGWPLATAPRAVGAASDRWAIGGAGGRLSVRPWQAGAPLWANKLHDGAAISAVVLRAGPSNPNLATGGVDATTRLTRLSTKTPVKESAVSWTSASVGTQRLAWHGSVLYRAAGGQLRGLDTKGGLSKKPGGPGSTVFLWTSPTGATIQDIGVDSAGQRIAVATSSESFQVHLVELGTAKQVWKRGGLAGPSHRLAWRPDGTELLATGGASGVQVLSAKTGATLFALQGHLKVVTAVAWSADGARLLTASRDGAVRLWRRSGAGVVGVETAIRHCSWPCSAVGGVIDVAFRPPTGAEWVTIGADGGVVGWRMP